MARKTASKKRPPRKTDRNRSGSRRRDYQKILLGLMILLVLVLIAGIAARMLLYPRLPAPPAPSPAGIKPSAPAPPPKAPPYEVYPKADAPARREPAASGQPVGVEPPQVAVIIDDMGYDRGMARRFIALDPHITISIFPMSPHGLQIMTMAAAHGIETMIHLPMEPREYPEINPGPGALLEAMSPDKLIEQLRADLDALPSARGVNNHMGSRLTADADRMHQVFTVIKQRGLFFIDSRTTPDTVCRDAARLLQVPFSQRDVFLDHVQEAAFVRQQLALLVKTAKDHGTAVGIGHPYPVTLSVLEEMLPAIRKEVRLVPASRVVHTIAYAR